MACSMVKKFTGQRDDSILPGTREEILPPEAQTARDPGVTGGKKTVEYKTECKADDYNCAPPAIDQEATPSQ